jgi:hypothetical protein
MTPEYWRFSSAADETGMVKIAITHAAYAAIAAALPEGIDARPVEPAAGKVFVWLDGSLAGCLAALRRRGEDHSDVILRLAAIEPEEAWYARSERKGKRFFASALGRGLGTLELEIDDHERRAIERSLVALRSLLIEKVEDTTLTSAQRQAGLRELLAVSSALRKLRPPNRRRQPTQAAKA